MYLSVNVSRTCYLVCKERRKMEPILKCMIEEESELKHCRDKVDEYLKTAPKGKLRINKRNGKVEYYHIEGVGDSNGKYIRKNNRALAEGLAERSYCESVKELIDAKLKAVGYFIKMYPEETIEDVLERFNADRQTLIKPIRLSDKELIIRWESEAYEKKTFAEDDKSNYYTEKGERVRSKSEVIIANLLFMMNIPYRYECALIIGGRKIFPDFTILDVKKRRVIYMEHFGRMDDPEYAGKAVEKISRFVLNDICIGDNLVCTFETSSHPLDTREVRKILNCTLGII